MLFAGFFNAEIFSYFSGFNLTNHTNHSLYGAERGINTFHVITEGVGWWNCLISRKLFNVVLTVVWRKLSVMLLRTISKIEAAKRKKISFCELPEIIVENLVVWDDYETDYTIFNVCGKMIFVSMMNRQKPWNSYPNVTEKLCWCITFWKWIM